MKYILASKSPRRQELMKEISSSFDVIVKSIDESSFVKEDPISTVRNIAYHKGDAVAKENFDSIVISSDTIVVLDNVIYGKPKDEQNAYDILATLSNKTHKVITGYTVFYKGLSISEEVVTTVTFNKLTNELIYSYIASKSPMDKAGAYGIQDNKNFHIIKEINGSYDNVLGFPVEQIKETINRIISK